jgi:ferritin-like metal-binding protein YciE
MENKVEKALDKFVDQPQEVVEKAKIEQSKKVVLDEREGLIERVDKVFVTKDGKQLLRERY